MIKNHKVEFAEFFPEKLVSGKVDQRDFFRWCDVRFLWRLQNGEVNEINGRVRLQEIAPDTGARIGLARDKQNPQTVLDA